MLCGQVEKLEKHLGNYRKDKGGTYWEDVMARLTDSVAAGDCWQVPVEALPDDMNETDYAEGHVLGRLPACLKRFIENNRGEKLFCAFTSPEKVGDGDVDEPVMTLPYPAQALLEEYVAAEDVDGFLMNPWSDDFRLDREDAAKILDLAQKITEEQKLALHSYRIEPRAVIDTNQILDEWRDGWDDKDEKQEKWELKAYPIMADGRVLLLFEMTDEVYSGSYDSFHAVHAISHFRILEYQLQEGELRPLGKYRFSTQDAHVYTVSLYDGKLNAAICRKRGGSCSILPMVPTNDDGQFRIFRNVRRLITSSKQEVIVGYDRNLFDEERMPLLVFSEDGKVIKRYRDEYALACVEVNLDHEENIWFHMSPSDTVDMLDPESKRVISHPVALQGFEAMAMSSDRTRLFLEFSESEGGSVFYVLTLQENGSYAKPIRFVFHPESETDDPKKLEDYEVYGCASTMKSWVILNADGKLYLYDIDDF